MSLGGDEPRGFSPLHQTDEQNPRKPAGHEEQNAADSIESLFRYQPPSRANSSVSGRVSSATLAGVSPSSLYSSSRGSRVGAGAFMRSESSERLDDSAAGRSEDDAAAHNNNHGHGRSGSRQQRQGGAGPGPGPDHPVGPVGPVDRLLLLVDDGQSLSRRVLGNERQSARLGERLSALKTPLWQLQDRVRTQGERPPGFIRSLTEQVSLCLDVLLELTHPDWWNQIRRKVRGTDSRARGNCRIIRA